MESDTEDVTIDQEAIAALISQLSPTAVQASAVYVRLPIRFDSMQAEVNYLALFHLLDFGSGYDKLLLEKARRDAHETIQFGLLGMLMTDARMDHHFLREFTAFHVLNYFGVDASEEREVMPGITMTQQGPLGEFVRLIRDTANETGRALGQEGSSDLGAFILSFLDQHQAAGHPPSAAALVEKLAGSFPGFQDRVEQGSRQVGFFRKAQALAAQLYLRFGREDPRFDFQDMGSLTLDTGNVLPAVLRHHGVLRYSPAMAAVVEAGEDLGGDPKEVLIRAAVVEAGQRVCELAPAGAFLPFQLSLHLLHLAQSQPRYRDLPKHVTKGTVAY